MQVYAKIALQAIVSGICRRGAKQAVLPRLAALIAVIVMIISGCSNSSPNPSPPGSSAEQVRVAATIFPVADITKQLGGDMVEVITLLPPGASPHTFEPTPELMRDLSTARVLVSVGPGLDDWATRLVQGAHETPINLVLLDCLPVSSLITDSNPQTTFANPHVWLDPIIVRDEIAPAIAEALSEVRPEQSSYFASRLEVYQAALDDLDEAFRFNVSGIQNPRFISVHAAWPYLARRYGLEQVAVIESSPGQEPSVQCVADIVDAARRDGVTAVLTEPQLSTQTAVVIASEFSGHIVTLDPLGGPDLPGRDSYLKLMRYNLKTLTQGLQ